METTETMNDLLTTLARVIGGEIAARQLAENVAEFDHSLLQASELDCRKLAMVWLMTSVKKIFLRVQKEAGTSAIPGLLIKGPFKLLGTLLYLVPPKRAEDADWLPTADGCQENLSSLITSRQVLSYILTTTSDQRRLVVGLDETRLAEIFLGSTILIGLPDPNQVPVFLDLNNFKWLLPYVTFKYSCSSDVDLESLDQDFEVHPLAPISCVGLSQFASLPTTYTEIATQKSMESTTQDCLIKGQKPSAFKVQTIPELLRSHLLKISQPDHNQSSPKSKAIPKTIENFQISIKEKSFANNSSKPSPSSSPKRIVITRPVQSVPVAKFETRAENSPIARRAVTLNSIMSIRHITEKCQVEKTQKPKSITKLKRATPRSRLVVISKQNRINQVSGHALLPEHQLVSSTQKGLFQKIGRHAKFKV